MHVRRTSERREAKTTVTRSNGSKRKDAPVIVTAADEALLQAVYAYQFLTVEQATRLLYSRGSLVYVRAKLRVLSENGYLQWLRLPTTGQGNAPHIYTLARKGIRHLEGMGYSDFARFRPN